MNIKEIRHEYSKVKWPSRDEVVKATILVACLSAALSIYLGAFDLIASRLLEVLKSFVGG